MIIDVSRLPDEVRGWPYAARDADGTVWVFSGEPVCRMFSGRWAAVKCCIRYVLSDAVFDTGDEHWTDSLTDLRSAWAELGEQE